MNEILYHTLRKYRLNQLTQEEKIAFEQQLATDPAFAAEAAEYATMLAGIQEKGNRILDAQLTEYARELLQTETQITLYTSNVRKLAARRRFLYAAAAVFLLLVVALIFVPDSSPTSQELFAANFSPSALSSETRDEATETWLKDYELGLYGKVIADLNVMLTDEKFSQRSAAYLYIGASKLQQGHPEEALAALSQVSPDSYDKEAAEWFTAMAYLKMGKKKEAKTIIDDVVQHTGHPFYEQAKKISEEL